MGSTHIFGDESITTTVNPAYDNNTKLPVRFGTWAGDNGLNPIAANQTQLDTTAPVRWTGWLTPLYMCGTHVFDKVIFISDRIDQTRFSEAYIGIYELDGFTITQVLSIAIESLLEVTQTSPVGLNTIDMTSISASLRTYTLDADKQYYFGFWGKKYLNAFASYYYPIKVGEQTGLRFELAGATDVTSLDSRISPTGQMASVTDRCFYGILYTQSADRIIFDNCHPSLRASGWDGTSLAFPVPIYNTTDTYSNVTYAIAYNLDVGLTGKYALLDWEYYQRSSATLISTFSTKLDFAANQITGGKAGSTASVSLDASEATDEFNVAMALSRNNENSTCYRGYVFWSNILTGRGPSGGTTDVKTTALASAANILGDGSRKQFWGPNINNPTFLSLSSDTAAVAEHIIIGRQVMIFLGDSQSSNGPSGGLPNQLEHIAKEISGLGVINLTSLGVHRHPYWIAGQSGTNFSISGLTSTAGYLRVNNDTIGNGDLCEIIDGYLIICGYGVNDVIDVDVNANSEMKWVIGNWLRGLGQVVQGLILTGERITPPRTNLIMIGIPPTNQLISARTDEQEEAIRTLNRIMSEYAYTSDFVFYNPYNLVQAHITAYLNPVDGLHYVAAGEQAVATAFWQWLLANKNVTTTRPWTP